ncbi:hypothetical protein [Sphingomonas sp. 10B4]|nr:hypothetical protein [Sphingomonas sp. 10B4]MDY7526171.1 hypothetical protein [Sphingomonas sp. 10B4]
MLIIEDVDRLGRDAEHIHHMVKLFRRIHSATTIGRNFVSRARAIRPLA